MMGGVGGMRARRTGERGAMDLDAPPLPPEHERAWPGG